MVAAVGIPLTLDAVTTPECTALDSPVYYDEDNPAGITETEIVCTDSERELDFTAPIQGLEQRDLALTFATDIDRGAPPAAADVEPNDPWWGFAIFTDPALTEKVPFGVQNNADGDGWEIQPMERPAAFAALNADDYANPDNAWWLVDNSLNVNTAQEQPTLYNFAIGDTYTLFDPGDGSAQSLDFLGAGWGTHDTYYVVRYVDADGNELERPVVSQISLAQHLQTPLLSFSRSATPGYVDYQWSAIEGATAYYVVRSVYNEIAGQTEYAVLGVTTETTWSTTDALGNSDSTFEQTLRFDTRQNSGALMHNPLEFVADVADPTQYNIGVIAVELNDDLLPERASSFAAATSIETLVNAPMQIDGAAFDAQIAGASDDTDFGPVYTPDTAPLTVPVITVGGTSSDFVAIADPETVDQIGPGVAAGTIRFQVKLYAAASHLVVPMVLEIGDGDNIYDIIDAYNERAAASAPLGGSVEMTVGIFEPNDAQVLDSAPDVDFPYFGSSEFVQFVARHMVNRSEAIDVSHFTAQPGAPGIVDVVFEAWYQNPYTYVLDFTYQGSTIWFNYAYDDATYQAHQQELFDAVGVATDAATSAGMSDAQIATAINNWIVANTEYDSNAYDLIFSPAASAASNWRVFAQENGILHAWEANGGFVQGRFVCDGYTRAFQAMAAQAGLNAVYVSGIVTQSGIGHAWNKVYVGGQWLSLDVTWNDSSYGNRWLLIDDAGFTAEATRTVNEYWIVDDRLGDYF
ncbi:MAG: transglutaminase domain-containing protein [Beutenbergiaceae bacterium]